MRLPVGLQPHLPVTQVPPHSPRVADDDIALRALAHPLRLRLLSLLTGAAMSAAQVAREVGGTHANASYHAIGLEPTLTACVAVVVVATAAALASRSVRTLTRLDEHEPVTQPPADRSWYRGLSSVQPGGHAG